MPEAHPVDYARPPVVETILGVHFRPLGSLTNAHLGWFWKALGADWPEAADAPLLPVEFESPKDGRWASLNVQLRLTQDAASRLRIKNAEQDRMVQVQRDRLHLNWLGASGRPYPRYPAIRSEFEEVYDSFCRFVAEHGLGSVEPAQWELTYVNHIPQGTVWDGRQDWSFFRPLGDVTVVGEVAEFESFSGSWQYALPEERGRLHVGWQHAQQDDGAELVRLDLTTRGPVSNREDWSLFDGLDLGRNTIVRAFRAAMSDEANSYWGIEDAAD